MLEGKNREPGLDEILKPRSSGMLTRFRVVIVMVLSASKTRG